MTNREILKTINAIENNFFNSSDYIPVKLNFYLIKNYGNLLIGRIRIVDTIKTIESALKENKDLYLKEVEYLLNLNQNIEIETISLSFLKTLNLNNAQIKALDFMIESNK